MQIKSIIGKVNSRYNNDSKPWEIVVTVEIDNDRWRKSAQNGTLGSLYVQVSNEVYDINRLIPAHNPLVCGHDKRAKKGVKHLKLIYFLSDIAAARQLGFKVICNKYSAFSDYVSLYETNVIPLRGVS